MLMVFPKITLNHMDAMPPLSARDQTMLEVMMRSLRLEAGGAGGRRLDPLLRQIMVSAVERTRDQRERDTLEPPSTRQELSLDMVLVLSPCTVPGRTRYCAS